MTITIEVDGTEYEKFTSVEVENTLDSISGRFFFSSRTKTAQISPFQVGQASVIRVENESVINGFIERISIGYDKESHIINVEGRDRTCDIIDSTIDNIEFKSASLKTRIEQVLIAAEISTGDGNGNIIRGIRVINSVNDLTDFKENETISVDPGETIFEFLERMAKMKQVFLITDGNGNVVISRSEGNSVNELLVNDPANQNSNILGGSVTYDSRERFNQITVKGQDNPQALNSLGSLTKNSNIVSKSTFTTDVDVRVSRKFTVIADSSYSDTQLGERATWEVNIRRIRGSDYSCRAQGFRRSKNSGIWRPNQLVQVIDRFAEIDAKLIINRVVYTLSDDEGSKTQLFFVEQDAYQVQALLPVAIKKSNDFGGTLNI